MNLRGEQAAMRARYGSVRKSGARKAKQKKPHPVKKSAAEWLKEYLDYLTGERGYSENTINAYRSDLEQFREALARNLLTASTEDIRRFVLFCLEGGASPKTARRKLSSVKGFYQFVFDEYDLSRDPSRDIRAPKAFKAIIRPIAAERS